MAQSVKLSAQHVCNILNDQAKKNKEFFPLVRARLPISNDMAENSDVMCSETETGYDTSALGIINALVDEPIALGIFGDDIETEGYAHFELLSKCNIKEGK